MDPFTKRRMLKFTKDTREKTGQLPTLQDYEKSGFPKKLVEEGEKENIIEQFYVTLTNGTILKGYKIKD